MGHIFETHTNRSTIGESFKFVVSPVPEQPKVPLLQKKKKFTLFVINEVSESLTIFSKYIKTFSY
jgi:hypothetical protein